MLLAFASTGSALQGLPPVALATTSETKAKSIREEFWGKQKGGAIK